MTKYRGFSALVNVVVPEDVVIAYDQNRAEDDLDLEQVIENWVGYLVNEADSFYPLELAEGAYIVGELGVMRDEEAEEVDDEATDEAPSD
jgi:hypothetical protein